MHGRILKEMWGVIIGIIDLEESNTMEKFTVSIRYFGGVLYALV